MVTSRTQIRFGSAWEFASRIQTGGNQGDRLRLVKGLPQRLIAMGLGQTLLYLEEKEPLLFRCLSDHLLSQVFNQPNGDLADLMMNSNSDYYLWASAEAREFAVWLKLSASALEG